MNRYKKRMPRGMQTNGATKGTYNINIVPPMTYARLVLQIKSKHFKGIY